ncbi:hypothetical protein B0920_22830 [Massilia sp. KIM]|nr:hypothetical protein B0920_22830 [Massilia sp. KIM]
MGDKDKGAILAGALLGGAAGGFIGADIDQRRCDLAKVAREYQLQMQFAAITKDGRVVDVAELDRSQQASSVKKNAIGSVVSLQDDGAGGGHFETNSDVLTRRAEQYFSAIADIYNLNKAGQAPGQQADRKLLLVGHTDDTGSSKLNAELSERRARAVADYLQRRGIPREQVFYQGAGEVYPVADNNTEDGRAKNRRVEIVEMTNTEGFSRYLEERRPNYHFYRSTIAQAAPAHGEAANAQAQAATGGARPNHSNASRPISRQVATPPAPGRTLAATPARTPASAATSSSPVAAFKTVGKPIDFGGTPMVDARLAAAGIGKLEQKRPLFSLISNAYADDVPVLADCSQDRPRITGAVKALKDGATYRVAEHVPGLYGKSWTERVNGHQIVINKVAVLASEASLAQMPEMKVYANYDPSVNRNPSPDVTLRPAVNTYLAEGGILYRIFTNGAAGMQCVDILYPRQGGAAAKGGNIVYARDNRLYVSAFKPVIAN